MIFLVTIADWFLGIESLTGPILIISEIRRYISDDERIDVAVRVTAFTV